VPLSFLALLACLAGVAVISNPAVAADSLAASGDLSPSALVVSPDGQTLYLACAAANQVAVFNSSQGRIMRRFRTSGSPSGLALSADGARLFVACAGPSSEVCELEAASGMVLTRFAAGHTALSPVVSGDGKMLFVCNRFNDSVSMFDLGRTQEVARVPVPREPVSAALTHDGRFLLVANHLPAGRVDITNVAAVVSVIEVAQRKVVKELRLPNGSINLRQMGVSPDGRYACVVLTVGRFHMPVIQVERGWVNTSALTIIDLASMSVLNTVLLDDVDRGAANPWAVAWSADGRLLCVTHAGTHELSIIDFPSLLKKLAALPATPPAPSVKDIYLASRSVADVPNDLSFLHGLRRRVQLHSNGPRALAISGSRAFVAGYFSDTLDIVPIFTPELGSKLVPLNPAHEMSKLHQGEMYFNDATICFQGWQSCASCHDEDARVDALNWDLLNDGIGNPKNTKSLVLCYQTPPVMSLGVRANAGVAVRSGIVSSLSSEIPEAVPAAMDEWLQSLRPVPSPRLVNGRLSDSAQRGEKIFRRADVGCASCHPPGLFTDLHSYDVGTHGSFDRDDKEFDTPTLVELWRTAPYLHDGSAATIRDVLTTHNPKDEHGKTSRLTPQELDDLIEYVLSL
jgi:DNA-binding beta-propeller fold protein YncE/mono/diheme cytochrome c family protein